jgi:hypothetical protein
MIEITQMENVACRNRQAFGKAVGNVICFNGSRMSHGLARNVNKSHVHNADMAIYCLSKSTSTQ